MKRNTEKGIALKRRWRHCMLLLCPILRSLSLLDLFRHMPQIKPPKSRVLIIKGGYLVPTSATVVRAISSGLRQSRRPFLLTKPRIQDDRMGWLIPIKEAAEQSGVSHAGA